MINFTITIPPISDFVINHNIRHYISNYYPYNN